MITADAEIAAPACNVVVPAISIVPAPVNAPAKAPPLTISSNAPAGRGERAGATTAHRASDSVPPVAVSSPASAIVLARRPAPLKAPWAVIASAAAVGSLPVSV